MQATSQDQDEAIVVSDKKIPMPIRLICIGVSVALSIKILIEFFSVLWPLNLFTLLFGIMILIGLPLLMIFFAFFAMIPDQRWEIQRGQITITYQLFNQIAVKTYRIEDLDDGEVHTTYDDDRPTRYRLMFPILNGRKLQTVPPRTPFHLAFGVFLRETNLAVRGATSKQDKSLVSPDFTKRVEAENALAHFTGRWGGGRSAPIPHDVGVASMSADGVITLDLYGTAPGGIIAHGHKTYSPRDADYAQILAHLGGLRPGDRKPVPPWP